MDDVAVFVAILVSLATSIGAFVTAQGARKKSFAEADSTAVQTMIALNKALKETVDDLEETVASVKADNVSLRLDMVALRAELADSRRDNAKWVATISMLQSQLVALGETPWEGKVRLKKKEDAA
jgi:hypothetical protein